MMIFIRIKKMKKLFKWIGIVLAVLILIAVFDMKILQKRMQLLKDLINKTQVFRHV